MGPARIRAMDSSTSTSCCTPARSGSEEDIMRITHSIVAGAILVLLASSVGAQVKKKDGPPEPAPEGACNSVFVKVGDPIPTEIGYKCVQKRNCIGLNGDDKQENGTCRYPTLIIKCTQKKTQIKVYGGCHCYSLKVADADL